MPELHGEFERIHQVVWITDQQQHSPSKHDGHFVADLVLLQSSGLQPQSTHATFIGVNIW